MPSCVSLHESHQGRGEGSAEGAEPKLRLGDLRSERASCILSWLINLDLEPMMVHNSAEDRQVEAQRWGWRLKQDEAAPTVSPRRAVVSVLEGCLSAHHHDARNVSIPRLSCFPPCS